MPSIAQEDWDIPSMDFHASPNGTVNLLKRRRDVANLADVMEREDELQMKINRYVLPVLRIGVLVFSWIWDERKREREKEKEMP